jgi:hypothetical protein
MKPEQSSVASPHAFSSGAVHWDRIASLTERLVAGDVSGIEAAFAAFMPQPPVVRWSPELADLTTRPLRVVLEYWSGLARHGALPHYRQVDPAEMRNALGYVMLVDAVDGGRDFRYRLYGSIIARISGADMTGRLLSWHHASPYVAEFAIAVYRAAALRRRPIYTERTPVLAERTTRWQRLALPLRDDSDEVARFLAVTVPLSREGRVIAA